MALPNISDPFLMYGCRWNFHIFSGVSLKFLKISVTLKGVQLKLSFLMYGCGWKFWSLFQVSVEDLCSLSAGSADILTLQMGSAEISYPLYEFNWNFCSTCIGSADISDPSDPWNFLLFTLMNSAEILFHIYGFSWNVCSLYSMSIL
jgi:hypothetical protein